MDKEYIERRALLATYRKWLPQLVSEEDAGDKRGVETCIAVLEQANAADVVEVRHSSWGESSYNVDEDDLTRPCLACGYDSKVYGNYCPNCGAKMDGGINNG